MARIVFIGDDFTGASDTLATLAERGAKVRLFLDAPEEGETEVLDAVGVATDLRTSPPDDIVARLTALAPAIGRLSPRFIHYKVCSTFDSAPHIGSIGAAVNALEAALAPSRTIILGGQPSLGRYCVFGTLFARAPDGETYRIDRHPIMRRHPVTPMHEADLRVHLARQGVEGLRLVSRLSLHVEAETDREWMSRSGRSLFDAIEQADVERLGQALRKIDAQSAPVLIVGASSVAEALLCGERPRMSASGSGGHTPGSLLAIAGSRSSATAVQIAAAASYERLPLDHDGLASQAQFATRCARLLDAGANVMVHLQPELDYGRSPAVLSDWLAELTHAILHQHPAAGLAVAGGDTSSAVVKRLGFRSLSFVERAGAGVAICKGHAPGHPTDGTILLLKGGQVGDGAVFERFAARFRA